LHGRSWIASAYAQGRFGGLQARHGSREPSNGGSPLPLLAMMGWHLFVPRARCGVQHQQQRRELGEVAGFAGDCDSAVVLRVTISATAKERT
jgi:hypothetical protein